jgi:hydrogen cyanide synthase HcnB
VSAATPSTCRIVIVGAGPAGTRAAQCLVRRGLRPTVVTDAPSNGGQIYRRQPEGFQRTPEKLYGSESRKARALHADFDALRPSIDFRPATTVFNVVERTIFLDGPRGIATLEFDALLLATGAMDRVLPLPGWTLPGVFTLGGAQIALKHQACAIGEQVAFVGTGPLLYLVAYQYAKAGARVAGVLDTSSFGDKVAGLTGMLASPRAAFLGLYYMGWLQLHGIPVHQGVRPLAIDGSEHVQGLRYRDARGERSLSCDAVGLGFGLKPENQLAQLAGCELEFNDLQRIWSVRHDGAGRARPGVYVAGDCTAIEGADAAELQGELAALSLLADFGMNGDDGRDHRLRRELKRLHRFRRGIERAFPFPTGLVEALPRETIVCRCEAVTLADLDDAVSELHPDGTNRLKAFSRIGMGRCQGRVCGPFVCEYLAARAGKAIGEIAPLRPQAPIKPLALAKAAQLAEPGHAVKPARASGPETCS